MDFCILVISWKPYWHFFFYENPLENKAVMHYWVLASAFAWSYCACITRESWHELKILSYFSLSNRDTACPHLQCSLFFSTLMLNQASNIFSIISCAIWAKKKFIDWQEKFNYSVNTNTACRRLKKTTKMKRKISKPQNIKENPTDKRKRKTTQIYVHLLYETSCLTAHPL